MSLRSDDMAAANLLYRYSADNYIVGKNISIYFWNATLTDLQIAKASIISVDSNGLDIPNYFGFNDVRGFVDTSGLQPKIKNVLDQFVSLGLISSFHEVTTPLVNGALADISFGLSYITDSRTYGATIVGKNIDAASLDADSEAVIFFSKTGFDSSTERSKNYFILHELAHAVGLQHPWDVGLANSPGDKTKYNSQKYTIMAYNSYDQFSVDTVPPDSLMLLDYLALKNQGLLKVYNAEDGNVYSWGTNDKVLHTIYDSYGSGDVISAEGHTRNTIIDLRDGHFSSYGATDKSGEVPVENLAIAYDTIIENAIGGNGDDVLIGNDINNELKGGSGNDFIYGSGEDYKTTDWKFSQAHKNAYAATVDSSTKSTTDNDTLYGGDGDDHLFGLSGKDTLYGDAGKDELDGGTEDDELHGGSENDTLRGGDGKDTLFGDMGDDSIEGGKDSDHIYGDYKEFSVVGGKDIIDGGEGDDILEGGSGKDIYKFSGDFGRDIIIDSDGLGSIELSGLTGNFTSLYGSKEIYRDASQSYEAIKIDNGTSTDLLLISLAGATNGSIIIKKWHNGDLGLSLTDTPAGTGSGGGGGNAVMGDGGNNAITLDNLRDNNPGLDVSSIGNLYADGGAGNDVIMGMLNGNDVILGGEGNDLISAGFTSKLGSDALSTMGSTGGADNIDGGGGNDFIFAAAGGGMIHGGKDNDVLVATGPAFFQFNNIAKVNANLASGIAGHPDITRDQVLADMRPNMTFSGGLSGNVYSYSTSYFSNLTDEYVEYTSAVAGVKYIGKKGGGSNSYSNGDVSYSFSGNYTFTYDYAKTTALTPIGSAGSPVIVATSTFTSTSGAASDNKKGANLFGDEGDDFIRGGIYADYLSGGANNDGLFGGGGNDVLDGGADNDYLAGQDGKDILLGGDGNDTLDGGEGNDFLIGGKGVDHFNGGNGDNIIVASFDDGSITSGTGNNIYIIGDLVFREADLMSASTTNNLSFVPNSPAFIEAPQSVPTTTLTIRGGQGNNTLALVGASSTNQLSLTAQGSDLILRAGNAAFFIEDGMNGTVDHIALGNSVEEFTGSSVAPTSTSFDDFMLTNLTSSINRTAQTAGTQIVGGLLNDTLTAHVGGSTIIGGGDDDLLQGNLGDDIYVVRKNDGNDIITEKGGNNTIKLDQGFVASQLTAQRNGADFLIKISSDQTITVKNMFNATTGELVSANSIQQILFYDNTVITLAQLQQLALTSTNGDDIIAAYNTADTLKGGKGNDQLIGGAGNDLYQYALGDGNDVITDTSGTDTLELGAGITQAQVTAIRDGYNNLVLRFANGGSIVVNGAFDASGNFTANAIETIKFSDGTWDLTKLKIEVAKETGQLISGTTGADNLPGTTGKDIFKGGKGNDQLSGRVGDDVYQYALGDGNDIIIDKGGLDRIEFTSGITQSNLVARKNGNDLVLLVSDGGSVTVKDMFATPSQTTVDPLITNIIQELQTKWMSQAEARIEQFYGLVGSGDITLKFVHEGKGGAEAAHVEIITTSGQNLATSLALVIDLDDFAGSSVNGTGPLYNDRIIAHEMVHAVMALNTNMSALPGWFTEGTAEFIHGADERIVGDLSIINNLANFNTLFKTTVGSPSQSAGYSVSYIAVKLLDSEIRAQGGQGIIEVFAQLKAGKTLNDSLITVSATHGGMNGKWTDLASFETHVRTDGFNVAESLLNLSNSDTGAIGGSDYGNSGLDASSVIPNTATGPSKYFNLIIPQEYLVNDTIENAIELIKFSDGSTWDVSKVNSEILKNTGRVYQGDNSAENIYAGSTNDTLIGSGGNDSLSGGDGNDIYIYAQGDGSDVITDVGGVNTLKFDTGITENNIKVKRNSSDLEITLSDYSTVIVKSMFNGTSGQLTAYGIGQIAFSNGNVWDLNQIKVASTTGSQWDDYITAYDTDDVITGGKGSDSLFGLAGNDTYVFDLGDGHDYIAETGGIDTVKLGVGINESDVMLRFDQYNELAITINNNDALYIKGMYNESTGSINADKSIERIQFANGNSWDLTQIYKKALSPQNINSDRIYAYDTDDILTGGIGADYISGQAGNDTYIFNAGDGQDIILDKSGVDKIKFGAGINPNDLMIVRRPQSSGSSLIDTILMFSNGDMLTLQEDGSNASRKIETYEFANGDIWNTAKIESRVAETAAKSNIIVGTNSWDVLTATSSQNSYLVGLAGGDDIKGGAGNDTLVGVLGSYFESNIFDGGSGADTFYFGLDLSNDHLPQIVRGFRDSGDRIVFTSAIKPTDVTVRIDVSSAYQYFMNSGSLGYTRTVGNTDQPRLRLDVNIGTTGIGQPVVVPILIDGIFSDNNFGSGGALLNPSNPVGTVQFSDGTIWNYNQLLSMAFSGSDKADIVNGLASNDLLVGGADSDTLYGFGGADTLIGGKGDDWLNGGSGFDYYRFELGDGVDKIDDLSDQIEFGAGINPSDVSVSRSDSGSLLYGSDLILTLGNGQTITVFNIFDTTSGAPKTADEIIKFNDGTVWSMSKIVSLIPKNNGEGDSTYFIDLNHGIDVIKDVSGVDVLRFGEGINPNNIVIKSMNEGAATIFYGNNKSVTIQNMFSLFNYSTSSPIESIEFVNGEKWNYSQIVSHLKLVGTQSYDDIFGTTANDFIYGDGENDFLRGGSGNDTIYGGSGNDYVYGDDGDNLLVGGLGNDYVYAGSGGTNRVLFNLGDGFDTLYHSSSIDTIEFGAGISPDQVTVRYFNTGNELGFSIRVDDNNQIRSIGLNNVEIKFSNGVYWNSSDVVNRSFVGTEDNDYIESVFSNVVISGNDGDDSLRGLGSNITFDGGVGNDTMYSSSYGDDVYIGGKGSDQLSDNAGNDVYKFNRGDGSDNINDYGGADKIEFGVGIVESDIHLSRQGDNLVIDVGSGDQITVQSMFVSGKSDFNANLTIEQFQFKNGTQRNLEWVRRDIAGLPRDVTPPSQPSFIYDAAHAQLNGVAEVGSLVTLKNSNGDIEAQLNVSATDGTFTIPFLYINNENFYLTATDAVGNISTALLVSAPDLTKPSEPTAIFDNNGKIISGLAEANSRVEVKSSDNTALLGSAIADAITGAYSIALTTALINKETVNVTAKDTAGNMSIIKAIVAPDKTAPTQPTASFDTTGKIITGVAEAGSTVEIRKDGSTSILKSVIANATTGAYSITLTTALINKETVNVTAKDAAGNISVLKAIVAPDKTAPTQPTAAFDTTGKIINGVAEAGSTVEVKNSGSTTSLGTVVANATTGAYTLTLATALINKETVNVTAKDTAGNISVVKAIVAPDKTAPTQPTAAFDTTGKIITGVAEAGSTVEVKNSGNTTSLGTVVANATTGAYSITLTTALINKETVNVTAKDAAGNISVVKAIVAPDKTAPTQPTAAFDTTGKIITGVAEAGSTVEVKNSGNTTSLGTVVANATTGAYSITLTTALVNKETVNVSAKDAAGNVSAAKAIVAPDKTAPTQPTAAFDTTGKIITGVAEAGSSVEVKNSGNTTSLGTVVANATTGAYSITLTTALINKETVNVTTKDAAGNISVVKAIVAPDKTAPTQPTAAFDTTGKIITGVAEAGSTVEVKNSGNTTSLGTVVANATTGAYSITLTTALINKETVNVTAKDVAGNISVLKAIVAPDKTAPTQPTAAFDTTGKIIAGVAEAGSTVEVKNSGNTTSLGTVVANATTGAYSITLTTALINKETVNVTAKDAAGNVSVLKAIIAPDKTAPAKPTAAFDTTGKIITGVAEAGSTIEVKNSGNTTSLGTVTANATTGAYSITLTTALKNKEVVNVTAKDAAGNISAATSATAPLITAKAAVKTVKLSAPVSSESQVDNLIQAMASFAPPAASETKVLVGIYHDSHPLLVSHS